MFTVVGVEVISKEQPSSIRLKTEEEIDLEVAYRYGHMFVWVNDEELHRAKLTTDYTDSKMDKEDILEYLKEHLPDEMLTFQIKKDGKDKSHSEAGD